MDVNVKFVVNRLLLSVAWVGLGVWGIFTLQDLLIAWSPYGIGGDLVPPFGESLSLALVKLLVPLAALCGLVWLAETKLDPERHAHRKAFEKDLPVAQQKNTTLKEETTKLKNQLQNVQDNLDQVKSDYKVMELQYGAVLSLNKEQHQENKRLRHDLSSTSRDLNDANIKIEKLIAAEARAKQEAVTARATALMETKGELDQTLARLAEYQAQISTQIKAATQPEPADKTLSSGIKVEVLPTAIVPTTPKKLPRKNYTQ